MIDQDNLEIKVSKFEGALNLDQIVNKYDFPDHYKLHEADIYRFNTSNTSFIELINYNAFDSDSIGEYNLAIVTASQDKNTSKTLLYEFEKSTNIPLRDADKEATKILKQLTLAHERLLIKDNDTSS